MGRELKKLGYVKLTARPRHHSQNEYAMEDFKNGALPPNRQRLARPLPRGTPLEVWFQDEARIGQKNKAHPPLGQARHSAVSAEGSEDEISLCLWRHLPRTGQRVWPDPSVLQYPDHVAAPGGK